VNGEQPVAMLVQLRMEVAMDNGPAGWEAGQYPNGGCPSCYRH